MRILHRIYARWRGLYWLPCPICGHYFGGHEKRRGTLIQTKSRGTSTCPRCPGFWIAKDGRYMQIEPRMNESGELDLVLVVSSSAWERQPISPSAEKPASMPASSL